MPTSSRNEENVACFNAIRLRPKNHLWEVEKFTSLKNKGAVSDLPWLSSHSLESWTNSDQTNHGFVGFHTPIFLIPKAQSPWVGFPKGIRQGPVE